MTASSIVRWGPEPREADQFQLDQQARGRFSPAGRQALRHDPCDPAARIVFEAQDRIDDAAVAGAVVDAADGVERALATRRVATRVAREIGGIGRTPEDRPLPTEFELLAQVAWCSAGPRAWAGTWAAW